MRAFACGLGTISDICPQPESLARISADVSACIGRIQRISAENKMTLEQDVERARSFVHILRVFEVEILSLMRDWQRIAETIRVRTFVYVLCHG